MMSSRTFSRCTGVVGQLAAITAVFLGAGPGIARAADPAINVGVSEVVAAPDVAHLGVYPFVAGSVIIPAGPVAIVPSAGVEYCPELQHWGFVTGVVLDVPVAKWIGLDVAASFVHDQEGTSWSEAVFLAGGAAGVSFFADKWTVSPSLGLLGGLNAPGWVVVPSLNVAYTLDFSDDAAQPTQPAVGSAR